LWRDLLAHFGTINGTRENTRKLLAAGEAVLVFPGGGREVARHHGDHYPLVWRERIGFARLALEFGYPIVPFSMIGVDDMWDVVIDANDASASVASSGHGEGLPWRVLRGSSVGSARRRASRIRTSGPSHLP
jgi:1-acyl-sn-glycerol-3-phosphate acyltransferase